MNQLSTSVRIDQFLSQLEKSASSEETSALRKAFDELVRQSDDALASFTFGLVEDLVAIRMDPPSLVALVLLSLPNRLASDDILDGYGEDVHGLYAGVQKLYEIHWDSLEKESTENLRQMFVAMAADMRVIVVALAVRVQQMRRLVSEPDALRRKKVAKETLEVFAPLANRLGVWKFKSQLEDASLRELDPDMFTALEKRLSAKRKERNEFIQLAMTKLREELPKHEIQATVKGRSKHLYSIFMKMTRKGVGIDQIHDISAIRVITEEDKVEHCYAALGIVHSMWVPMPGEFDDYIARAKENGYQSLHTTVMGPGGKPLEVQIRTKRMNDEAEYGVITHWAYKEGRRGLKGTVGRFNLMRQLMDWEGDVSDPKSLAERLKVDVFQDQVYVFTPAGDVLDMPAGATPLDFAYRVHTMVGHRCRGAKVNDEIVPLDHQLNTGDRVEILTNKKPSPSRDWMNPAFGYLHTSSARTKVRQWFRDQDRDESIVQGRESVERELNKLDLKHVTLHEIIERFGYQTEEELYAAVGFGIRSAQSVASSAFQLEQQRSPMELEEVFDKDAPRSGRKSTTGVSLDNVDDILGARARCCNPVPGDKVMGYVSRGRGIIIHRRDCPNVSMDREPERWVEIEWGSRGKEQQRHGVKVEIKATNRDGLLRDLQDIVLHQGATVQSVTAQPQERSDEARIVMTVGIVSAEQLVRVLGRLDRMQDVLNVRRLSS